MRRISHTLLFGAAFCVAAPAHAQTVPPPGHFDVALSGFQNIVGAEPVSQPDTGPGILSESEIEVSPLYKTAGGTLIGVRGVFNIGGRASNAQSAWQVAVPEISAFAVGWFGRIEIGERAGFPQSLLGFTPSQIAFTAAPFGPDSGSRLDPDGRLPTQFLPPALAGRIDALTYLGYAARLYDDRSPKIIYLSPRTRAGVYGALSYTARTDRPTGFSLTDGARGVTGGLDEPLAAGRFRDVVQAALVWNHRTENLDLSTGFTYTHATADQGLARARLRKVDSLSAGVSATLHDSWALGVSATYDGLSNNGGNPVSGRRPTRPFGVVASIDYVQGPWVVGGYYQHAHADSLTVTPRRDTLDIGEIGVSYLADRNHDLLGMGRYTDVKLFAAAYFYKLRSDEFAATGPAQRGAVLLAGARFAFF
jgi:hypothetical protein